MSDDLWITILGEETPIGIFQDFSIISPYILKGFKIGFAPPEFRCTICQTSDNTVVMITDCNHLYHIDCIEKWFEISNNCQVCKNIITSYDRKTIQELLDNLSELIKFSILSYWENRLDCLNQEEINILHGQIKDYIDNKK